MFEVLLKGVTTNGETGALRITSTYQPTAGHGAKIFPPTYKPDPKLNPKYLFEHRYVDGERLEIVLIDSVQSQANRLEEGLVAAVDDSLVALPYLETSADIDGTPFRVTSLDAPHRSPDAYFRDSQTADGTPFDDSPVGKALRSADERNARAIYRYSPTDLVLGVWDSQRGGRGLRLPRAYTSEIIGLSPERGSRGAGRLDPYNIGKTDLHVVDGDRSKWALNAEDLPKGFKTKPSKPSEINHGNALAHALDAPGGVSVLEIRRTAIISLKVLRRLRFPDQGAVSAEADIAARAVLAALAILGDRLAFADSTLFLRSGCDLVVEHEKAEWVGRSGSVAIEVPDVDEALALYHQAVAHAESRGLSFADPVRLEPKANLRSLLALTFASPAAEEVP